MALIIALVLEHVYMRPEVNTNRFEISNRFEKSFRLHGDFITATCNSFVTTDHVIKNVNISSKLIIST